MLSKFSWADRRQLQDRIDERWFRRQDIELLCLEGWFSLFWCGHRSPGQDWRVAASFRPPGAMPLNPAFTTHYRKIR